MIVRSERIRAHHFEEKSPVALEPLVEQPLLVIILHRIRFAILLVANSDRILTTGEAVIEQFQFLVDVFFNVGDQAIELHWRDGKRLPPPTRGRDYASKMLSVA